MILHIKKDAQLAEDVLTIKLKLANVIAVKAHESNQSQDHFSKTLGLTQSQLSGILRGKVTPFTTDLLIKAAMKCGIQVSMDLI